MTKSITLELQDWANWVAQDHDGMIWQFKYDPVRLASHFAVGCSSECRLTFRGAVNPNWQNSKINLNTHSAYIDTEGILRRN